MNSQPRNFSFEKSVYSSVIMTSQNPGFIAGRNTSVSTQHIDHHISHTNVTLNNVDITSVTQNSSPRFIPSQSTAPLGMNIPLSLREPLENNSQIHSTLSEPQTLNRTTFNLDSASVNEEQENQENQGEQPRQQQSLAQPQSHNIGSLLQHQHMNSVAGYILMSSDDNNQNISVSPILDPSSMTARPVNNLSQAWSNSSNGNNRGAQVSCSSSNVSLKYIIQDGCLVKKLPWRIIKYIAETLQCRSACASWKDLVELYGWDYERTYLFENKQHDEGIFYSLLRELEFQNYSLEQLREDLFNLPRRDILNDLNKMITEHNASTGSCTNSHT